VNQQQVPCGVQSFYSSQCWFSSLSKLAVWSPASFFMVMLFGGGRQKNNNTPTSTSITHFKFPLSRLNHLRLSQLKWIFTSSFTSIPFNLFLTFDILAVSSSA